MSLVGQWDLTESSYQGGVFLDSAGSNDGTPANTPVFTLDQRLYSNAAITLNGTTDLVRIPNFNPVGDAGESFSAFCWANGASQNFKVLFSQWDSGAVQRSWQMIYEGGVDSKFTVLLAETGNGATLKYYRSSVVVGDGAYHECGFTWDNGTLKLFIDGAEDTSVVKVQDNAMTTLHVSTADVMIGVTLSSNNPSNPFAGDVCCYRLHDSVLTPSEITDYYTAGAFSALISIEAEMNFSGSISAQNPNWLLLDNSLGWRGEWDETTTYELDDAVLYKTGNGEEFHIFVSKTSHNTGNNPTTEQVYWRRYYQEQFV